MDLEALWKNTDAIGSGTDFFRDEVELYARLLGELPDNPAVLELGLQWGRSSSVVFQSLTKVRYVGVDPFIGENRDPEAWKQNVLKFVREGSVSLVGGFSHDAIGYIQKEGPYDLALIDADHRYGSCLCDLYLVAPHVLLGGWLLVHDYASQLWPDVKRAVDDYMDNVGTFGDYGIFEKKHLANTLVAFQRVA